MMADPNLAFLNKFVQLYLELVTHDGYGDMEIKIRMVQGKKKEVQLICGKEYRYLIGHPQDAKRSRRYKVVSVGRRAGYAGPERRSGAGRRQQKDRRDLRVPRNFRLERRLRQDRRSGKGRRWDD